LVTNYNFSISEKKLYTVNIFIDTEDKITYSNIVLVIEDILMKVFNDEYEEYILDKSLTKSEYSTILDKLVEQIEFLDVFVNNDSFLRLINLNKSKIDLTKEIIDSIY
jgi:hypothetical protein